MDTVYELISGIVVSASRRITFVTRSQDDYGKAIQYHIWYMSQLRDCQHTVM